MKRYVATQAIPPFGREGSRTSWRFQRTQKSDVYDAIVRAGKDGTTRNDIAKVVGLQPDRISFYLSDLRRSGYISVQGDPTVVSATMNAQDATFAALLGLENALIATVREKGSTDEMNRSYLRYTKFKERALSEPAPTSSPAQREVQKREAQLGLRLALTELIKLLY